MSELLFCGPPCARHQFLKHVHCLTRLDSVLNYWRRAIFSVSLRGCACNRRGVPESSPLIKILLIKLKHKKRTWKNHVMFQISTLLQSCGEPTAPYQPCSKAMDKIFCKKVVGRDQWLRAAKRLSLYSLQLSSTYNAPSPRVWAAMPPGGESEPQSRKRRRSPEVAASTDTPQPPVKQQKRSRRNRTPPQFWDNLSRVPLCPRALREFNRRITRPVVPKPPARSILKGDLVKQLKRFARHGGPNLRDIRGVGCL